MKNVWFVIYLIYCCISGWYVPYYLINHGYSLHQAFLGIFCIAIFNGVVGWIIGRNLNK